MGLLTRTRQNAPATIDRLRDEFDRVLQNWWGDEGDLDELFSVREWKPSVDLSETDDAIEVKVDLPGIKPDDVDISVSENRLTIQGERKEEKETKDKTRHRVERHYGSFYRSITLPPGTEADKVAATSDNGVITITVPKAAEAKATKVPVKPR